MSHAHFHTPASGAGPNGSLLGAKAAFQTQTQQETTQVHLQTWIWEMVHHGDSSAVHGSNESNLG